MPVELARPQLLILATHCNPKANIVKEELTARGLHYRSYREYVPPDHTDHSPELNDAEEEIKQEEDTWNADEFLSMQADFELYCRLCLCVSQNSDDYINIFPSQEIFSARGEKIQQMLQDIIPDLDLTLTFNPGICSDCEARLIAAYDFISLCTQNQDTLLNYKSKYAEGPFVNIQAVVEANTQTKKCRKSVPSAHCRKQKKTLVKDIIEDEINESITRNASNLKSECKNTIENVEIKVEKDIEIDEYSKKPFNSKEDNGEQHGSIQGCNISSKQTGARHSLYETSSRIPINLSEDTDNNAIAENTQQNNIKMAKIHADTPIVKNKSVNVSDVLINVKVEKNTDLHEKSHEAFNSIKGISGQRVIIQGYNIPAKQAEARYSLFETSSSSLGENIDNNVKAERDVPKFLKLVKIKLEAPQVKNKLLNVSDVPINVSNRSKIKIVEARAPDSSQIKSDDSTKR